MNRKSYPSFSSLLTILGVAFLAACSGDPGRDSAEQDPLVETDARSDALMKGRAGAINGANDYCNDSLNKCGPGEGDCDSNSQCQTGLVCGTDLGPRFGFGASTDVCVAPHCINGIKDANETGIDTGDGCGAAACLPASKNGSNAFCSASCPCAGGQGDCDSDKECQAGLTCVNNLGPHYGFSADTDVCTALHCLNGIKDGNETRIDAFGDCGSSHCMDPAANGEEMFCTRDCPCEAGQGDCDSDSECGIGLACGFGAGPRFGLPEGTDVCVAQHCANGVQDIGETGVDCGSYCGSCPPPPSEESSESFSGSCSGHFPSSACNSCIEESCCAEVSACANDPDCAACFADPTYPGCTDNEAWVAILQCADTSCTEQCPAAVACNPVTNLACAVDGWVCDLNRSNAFACFPPVVPPTDVAQCDSCNNAVGPFCNPGLTCVAGQCVRYCCDDGDCGSGTCDTTLIPGTAQGGVCQKDGGPVCDAPEEAPSGGSCFRLDGYTAHSLRRQTR